MKQSKFALSLIFVDIFILFAVTTAEADITWDWSFNSEVGQLLTEGTVFGGLVQPGTYEVLDFSVSSSSYGASIGSWLAGQYYPNGFATDPPYFLVWDGSKVTQWLHSGGNGFYWLVFNDLANSNYYFFGWETGNINTTLQAAYYPQNEVSGDLSVTVHFDIVPSLSLYALLLLVAGMSFTLILVMKKI
jgi:hypothetical protein